MRSRRKASVDGARPRQLNADAPPVPSRSDRSTHSHQAAVRAGEDVLPPETQRVVRLFEQVSAALGHPLIAGARVLDFGCGAGRHVAEFRHHGYDAWGVDERFESHAGGSARDAFLRRVAPPEYTLPFPDDHFDFVYSTAVMEHVLDPGQAMREIARVVRPNGISIHVFPSRWRPIEPHMHVPFGGRFQSFHVMRLWARLGLRNSFQRGRPSGEVALVNVQFCKTGVSYPTAREWTLRAEPLFEQVDWAERHFIDASTQISRVSRLLAPFSGGRLVPYLYRGFHTRVLVLGRPRQ
jgi:SAM-dependent methyltransferase